MRDTTELALEVGFGKDATVIFTHDREGVCTDELKAFEALVRADEREQGQKWFDAVTAQHKQLILAEREACAKVCDELAPDMSRTANDASVWDVATFDCAAAIRARSQA